MDSVWYASFESVHFTFEVIGRSKEEVDARMLEAIATHCRQFADRGADIHGMLGDDESDWTNAWNALEMKFGYWYRDGWEQAEVLPPGHKYSASRFEDDDEEWDQAEEDARLRGALRDIER